MNTYPKLTKIVVVCGAPCGGTTLMLDMLRAHPRVFAPLELGLLSIDSNAAPSQDLPSERARVDLVPGVAQYGLDRVKLGELAGEVAKDNGNWQAFYERIFDHMVTIDKVQGRDIFIDKLPVYADCLLSYVYPKLPDVQTIVMVRDPRAVYCSWCKRPSRGESLPEAIARYAKLMYGAKAALDAGKPILMVRFEDLVFSPWGNMRQVAHFLGLRFCPGMTNPANSYDQFDKTKFKYPFWGDDRRLRATKLDLTVVSEWRELLEPGEADAIVDVLPDDLAWTLRDSGEDLPNRIRPFVGDLRLRLDPQLGQQATAEPV